jgi:hypothetical protein
VAQEINYLYERFLEKVGLLKKKFYRGYMVAKVLGIDKGNFSKYTSKKEETRIIPGDDTLVKFIDLLDQKLEELNLVKEARQEYGTNKLAKELRDLKGGMAKLNKKAEQIIALLDKKK